MRLLDTVEVLRDAAEVGVVEALGRAVEQYAAAPLAQQRDLTRLGVGLLAELRRHRGDPPDEARLWGCDRLRYVVGRHAASDAVAPLWGVLDEIEAGHAKAA